MNLKIGIQQKLLFVVYLYYVVFLPKNRSTAKTSLRRVFVLNQWFVFELLIKLIFFQYSVPHTHDILDTIDKSREASIHSRDMAATQEREASMMRQCI